MGVKRNAIKILDNGGAKLFPCGTASGKRPEGLQFFEKMDERSG
jgi:hypothetical protein